MLVMHCFRVHWNNLCIKCVHVELRAYESLMKLLPFVVYLSPRRDLSMFSLLHSPCL